MRVHQRQRQSIARLLRKRVTDGTPYEGDWAPGVTTSEQAAQVIHDLSKLLVKEAYRPKPVKPPERPRRAPQRVIVEPDKGICPRSVRIFHVTIAGQGLITQGESVDVWVERGRVAVPANPTLVRGIKVLEASETFKDRWDPVRVHETIVRFMYPATSREERKPDPRLLAEARTTGIARAYRVWQDPTTDDDALFWVSIGFRYTSGPSVPVEVILDGRIVKKGRCLDCGGRNCRHWWAVLAAIKQGVVKAAWTPPSGWNRWDPVTGEYTPMRGSRPVGINGRRVG